MQEEDDCEGVRARLLSCGEKRRAEEEESGFFHTPYFTILCESGQKKRIRKIKGEDME